MTERRTVLGLRGWDESLFRDGVRARFILSFLTFPHVGPGGCAHTGIVQQFEHCKDGAVWVEIVRSHPIACVDWFGIANQCEEQKMTR